MNKLLAAIGAVATYFPAVLSGIIAVESTIASAPGATKKAAVLASISAAAKVGEQVDESHVQAVSQLIDDLVAAFNKSGFFAPKKVAK